MKAMPYNGKTKLATIDPETPTDDIGERPKPGDPKTTIFAI
jgi:hypothetical protein